jgi:hypothetical protein
MAADADELIAVAERHSLMGGVDIGRSSDGKLYQESFEQARRKQRHGWRGCVLTARRLTGQPTPSSESSEVRWVPASEVAGYTIDRSMRIRIKDFLARHDSPAVT